VSTDGIKIHGAINLKGSDTEVRNFELEQRLMDPNNEHLFKLWYNAALSRVSYNELAGYFPVIRRLLHDGDLNVISNQINDNATSIINATTVSISEAISSVLRNTVLNNTNNNLLFGQPVYLLADGSVGPASANDIVEKNVLGFVSNNTILSNGGSGEITLHGRIVGTVEQWAMVTDTFTELIPNTNYFLSVNSGKITTSPLVSNSQYCCLLGRSISTTEFIVKVDRTITL